MESFGKVAAQPAELAPAKINLALHVTGRRADGYHLLESLAVFTAIGDRLTARAAPEDTIEIGGRFGGQLPAGAENLVLKARDAMRHVFGDCACPAVAVTLDKRLPVASGIGGGSSDAAAALRVLARHWGVKGSAALFRSLARTLGADVPMCLAARPLLASGVGDVLEPVEGMPALHLVLVNPGTPLSTPDVFRALARRDNPPLPPLPARLDAESLHGWLASTRNDLEVPAQSLVPDIAEALSALGSAGAAVARMSGSGATCFGLFSTGAAAARAAASIGAARPGWFCVATETLRQETGQ